MIQKKTQIAYMKMTAGASCDEDSMMGFGVDLWFLRKWARCSENAVCVDMALLVAISNDKDFIIICYIYYLLNIMSPLFIHF